MPQSSASSGPRHATARASLCLLGLELSRRNFFEPLRQGVHLAQKRVRYSPIDKLYQVFVACLAGAQGVVEVNHRLRPDSGLQAAFGCGGCAEQSVLQQTLDAATEDTLAQMQAAVATLFREYSRAYRHDYSGSFQLLDVDLSGMPCGPKAALATPGYLGRQRSRQGRQLGRVLATTYQEIVVDRLYGGKTKLVEVLPELVEAAGQVLALTPERRRRTLLRIDSGGGSLRDLNWALEQGYAVHAKDYSGNRAAKLMARVTRWVEDPKHRDRQVGWVPGPAPEYCRPVVRLAVRCRQRNGQWAVGVLVSSLTAAQLREVTGTACATPEERLLTYVYFYDQRGGGVETSFREDKSALGLTRRNKKRFEAQALLQQLVALAHNVLVWFRHWLEPQAPRVRRLGLLRLVRDLLSITGWVELDGGTRVCSLQLNAQDEWARHCFPAFQALPAAQQVALSLGQT